MSSLVSSAKEGVKSARSPIVAQKPTFIDLFCGCGGLTLGMLRAGFDCLAAIDADPVAVKTLKNNLAEVKNPLQQDLKKLKPCDLAAMLGVSSVDVIVGGPPCQGFSTARKRDGANHGKDRLVDDARRHLYKEFLKYVDFFQPKVFVIENVLGLRSAAGGEYLTRVQHEARTLGHGDGRPGYRVHGQIEDAYLLGVPQKRRRQLIVGVRADLAGYFPTNVAAAPRAVPKTDLGAAIHDLPIISAGHGEHVRDYDIGRRAKHLASFGEKAKNYLENVAQIGRAERLTNHVARPHSERDLGDFDKLTEGESSAVAMRRGVAFDYPYDKSTFKDRYTRQSRYAPCSTIVAHLSKDGLMFIHPTQRRSLTPREVARVQSFPDWFEFPAARTHAFRLMGNAVPPLVAEAVGLAVKQYLLQAFCREKKNNARASGVGKNSAVTIPKKLEDAAATLAEAKQKDPQTLRKVKGDAFLQAWHAMLFLFPGLHPDNALDHGTETQTIQPNNGLTDPCYQSCYLRSGWPVVLEPLGREAWRRYKAKQLNDSEFYCESAQRAGLVRLFGKEPAA